MKSKTTKVKQTNKQKNVIIFSKYEKKKSNIKSYIIVHYNKDKSITRYGVSKRGFRFSEKIIKQPTTEVIKKEFRKAQRKKDGRKNNITANLIRYEGKYLVKQKMIVGKQTAKYFYNINKKGITFSKIKMIEYTDKPNAIINQIAMITYDETE